MNDLAFVRDQIKERLRLSDVVARKVTFDRRKSQPARGEFWGCCPFHGEKTPSFHVVDATGYYHCFGCHAGGDVISFVMETENRSFPETIEMLAREAGVDIPERSPEAAAAAREAASLHDVLESAARFYEAQLTRAAGAFARSYLDGRGISPALQARFRIGYAPKGGRALIDHLLLEKIPIETMRRAGLLSARDEPRDLMSDRVIIPITDGRGRVIAFGGRRLSEEQTIKYLNSPETQLFVKGRTLFNLSGARKRVAGEPGPLTRVIVAEGYMDVIALVEAGFERAVAPLGTALTGEQIKTLFAIDDAPIICFDGDRAGRMASERALLAALEQLRPGKTLRFARLADNQDPDDLLRSRGADALKGVIEAAEPLAEALYRFAAEGASLALPDERARVEARLKEWVSLIRDNSVRQHYEAFVRERVRAFGRGPAPQGEGRPRPAQQRQYPNRPPFAEPRPAASPELLARASGGTTAPGEDLIALAVLTWPSLALEAAEALATLVFTGRTVSSLIGDALAILSSGGDVKGKDLQASLSARGHGDAIARLSRTSLRFLPATRPEAEIALARASLHDLIQRHAARRADQSLSSELQETLAGGIDEEKLRHAQRLVRARRSGGTAD